MRERVRDELRQEMVDLARDQLREGGADALSLRRIARDLELAPSAIHRYFANRDELITTLIIDGFNAVGATAEQADEAHAGDSPWNRWVATTSAIRRWALEHPHEYALIHGSPIPGYVAPDETGIAAARDEAVLGRIVVDAHGAGLLAAPTTSPALPVTMDPDDAARVRAAVMPGVPDDVITRALAAWSGVFGMISLEVFGHFNVVVTDTDTMFAAGLAHLGGIIGIQEAS